MRGHAALRTHAAPETRCGDTGNPGTFRTDTLTPGPRGTAGVVHRPLVIHRHGLTHLCGAAEGARLIGSGPSIQRRRE